MIEISEIKSLCDAGEIRWTQHICERLEQRGASFDDVVYALLTGEIIEQYPNGIMSTKSGGQTNDLFFLQR